MKNCKVMLAMVATICAFSICPSETRAQEKAAPATAAVHLVITDAALREDSEFPPLQKEDIKLKMGKSVIDPTELIPATGDRAALQLMILIDDILDSNIGNDLKDLQEFIKNLPEGGQVGVGCMSNAGISVAQNFTADRELAAKAIRLPRGTTSSMDSPYLSLISLVKGRPQQEVGNQYYLVFQAQQKKKDSLQSVNIRTATKNSEILAADKVWVPGPPQTEQYGARHRNSALESTAR